ncbi:hypothetical protein ARMGADRAFT_1033053 [Armillaria gallica]|uniref:Uncharacterized protein n=1 Tax=Armillaria gallica TaxID=47427 RepID=A0A2H3DF42_ARMGA|nr:hypothetical protein ARMGADRAFT_1033053 [Armillaria gallica]
MSTEKGIDLSTVFDMSQTASDWSHPGVAMMVHVTVTSVGLGPWQLAIKPMASLFRSSSLIFRHHASFIKSSLLEGVSLLNCLSVKPALPVQHYDQVLASSLSVAYKLMLKHAKSQIYMGSHATVPEWINHSIKLTDMQEELLDTQSRIGHGFDHYITGAFLCLIEYDWSD